MELQCPNCGVRYAVPPGRWPMATDGNGHPAPKPARARCKGCGHVWLATPEEPLIELDTPLEPHHPAVPPPTAQDPAPPRPALPRPSLQHPALARPAPQPSSEAEDDPEPEAAPAPPRRRRWLLAATVPLVAVAAGVGAAIGLGLAPADRLPPLPASLKALASWQPPVSLPALSLPAVTLPALALPAPPVPALGVSADAVARPLGAGGQVWEISGEVRNPGARPQPVPPLEVLLVDEGGTPLVRWTVVPSAGSLAPGGTLAFETSAINPPAAARRVAVRLKPAALARL